MYPTNRRRSVVRSGVAIVAAFAALIAFTACEPAEPQPPACELSWGSLAKTASQTTTAPIHNARAGQHTCYDRFVVDISNAPAAGWHVEYVDQATRPGTGHGVALRGGATIQASVRAPAHDANFTPTYSPANEMDAVDVNGFRTLRQVAFLDTFEGQTEFGIGVRARLPFRVFTLSGPAEHTRLVIDIAHRWP